MKKYLFVFVSFGLSVLSIPDAVAQGNADSLRVLLKDLKADTLRVNTLNEISRLLYKNEPDNAIRYANEANDLATTLDFQKGRGYAMRNLGLVYYSQSDYSEALIHWSEALKAFNSIGNKPGEANILSNMAVIYMDKADYVRAVEYLYESLRIAEQLRDTVRLATVYNNLGSVFEKDANTYDKALENYFNALRLAEAARDLEAIGIVSSNIGEIYQNTGKYDEALVYFNKSLKAYSEHGDTYFVVYTLASIGKAHALLGDYDAAVRFQSEALRTARQNGFKLRMLEALSALGTTYKQYKHYSLASKTFLEAEEIGKEIGARAELKNVYEGLAAVYSATGDHRNAFNYQQSLIAIKDLLYTDENRKNLERLQFEFDLDKKESQISLLTKDKELKELELQKQKVTRNGLIAGLGLLGLLAFFLYRNYQIKAKSNRMLAQQNHEISQQKEEIEAQRDDIESQKTEIENLILNILPLEVAQELRKTGTATPRSYDSVTVLFTDFKEFTKIAENMSAAELVEELNECFIAFDQIIEEFGLEKIKTIGDAYMCACGIPTPVEDHPFRTVRAALAIQRYIDEMNQKRAEKGAPLWELRIGIHTGPLTAGVVGRKKFAYDIWGNSVNIAARLETAGHVGKVNISETTYHLIKENFECSYRGKIMAKNIGNIDMYFVEREIRPERVEEPVNVS
jgi:adenylate cyclase